MKTTNCTYNKELETSPKNQPDINNTTDSTSSDERMSCDKQLETTYSTSANESPDILLVFEPLEKATTHLSALSYLTLNDT
ncbi:9961_t:CDS:2 [Dentiscutata erythropus]|uniref:9961_t:CDS:1 n=1 Tax=Dentiscutata erythropus TaxID=1348616 RepID=A0A9N9IQ76_9GLOM|nr:9961_t:CDS:2 [Dentiscutata erythropus]